MTENKYQRGKIYKLISNQTEGVYYGSTIEDKLTNRLAKHQTGYKSWLGGKQSYITSYEIMKFEDAKIILVENYPCNTVYELTAREQYYIDNNVCVNKYKAPTGLSREEQQKQYYKDHEEEKKKHMKQYREDHEEEKTI